MRLITKTAGAYAFSREAPVSLLQLRLFISRFY
jgi:hypothetical protein